MELVENVWEKTLYRCAYHYQSTNHALHGRKQKENMDGKSKVLIINKSKKRV